MTNEQTKPGKADRTADTAKQMQAAGARDETDHAASRPDPTVPPSEKNRTPNGPDHPNR